MKNFKRLLPLLALPMLALTACDTTGEVEHPWVGGAPKVTTTIYIPPSTTTTAPTPDLTGHYCWVETNPASPDGVEQLCDTSLAKVDADLFLHWGAYDPGDSEGCWTSGEGICNIRFHADDVQTSSGNWVPRSFYDQNMKDAEFPNIARTAYLPDQVVHEDSKWWRCSIDGNGKCG